MAASFGTHKGVDNSKGKKVLIYGKEGVGKTILASHFPDALFMDLEGSTAPYDHITRLSPTPKSWEEIQDAIAYIAQEKPCKTLVIDAFDKAEELELKHLVKEAMKREVEPKSVNLATLYGGYGKAYQVSEQNIRTLLCQLDDLKDMGINVVVICHAQVKSETIPGEVEKIDHYELKLGSGTGSKTSAALKEWSDIMIFCEYKTYIMTGTSGMTSRAIAKGGEERIMHCNHTARFDAKNRYGLGNDLPLDYAQLKEAIEGNASKPQRKTETKPVEPAQTVQPIEAPKEDLPSTLWETPLVPKEVSDLVGGYGYSENDLKMALYMNGFADDSDFDWTIVPRSFWDQVVSQWDDFKQLLDKLPF